MADTYCFKDHMSGETGSIGSQSGSTPVSVGAVTIATTVDEVEALRDRWRAIDVKDIDSDIDYFLTIVRCGGTTVRPYVVYIRREGGRDLLGISRIERVSLPLKFGYRKLVSPEFRAVVVTFGGIVGTRERADEELLLDYLQGPLDTGDADLLLLRNIDVNGTLYKAASARGSCLRRSHGREISGRWMARLPDTLDRFLEGRSSKTRQRLKGQDRKLLRDYAGRLRLHRFENIEEMAELCRDMERVASRTYQRGLGAGFLNSSFDRALLEETMRQGWHRTWMLYLDDVPVAFWTGTNYASNFAIGTPGFDPDYTKDSVGRFTMFRMVEDLCADPTVSMLDFGYGEADYKTAFGECQRYESTVLITSRRPFPIAVNLAASLFSIVNSQGRRLIKETEWGRRLKRMWRGRAAAGGNAERPGGI
ncbi:Acetyltransferase involved in cellulose biosynthesis, CelD/BcsL family [Mesorhizobium albiziae]|uniref:Acetyltransferase involved in cellulose biosynthesis, CelD/BcsL family n=1 Tax=Neomesorhizobium albiziae TaxID=335020 RepID=A0A1I3XK16_9HYPH|nr:GNAT family N-acetyltransferase [Mesorhizobium albiziae]GLS30381.1 hypothetical protein GCM10007937_20890 [Mesorhizobium albiziae]SFK19820.1 Acetyltransferase involved in cellulose biosynthesis, CelD/BcsL family [Mesorhizobium albiziae]